MTRPTTRSRLGAGVLALVVAGVHLYWGIPRFVAYATVGSMPDPRPLAFVLSGHAILVAVTLVALGVVEARWTCLRGAALMLVHLVAYTAWHTVLSHGVAGAADHGYDHFHVGDAAIVVLEHVANSPLALVSKAGGLAVLALLVGLYVSGSNGSGPSVGPAEADAGRSD